MITEAVDFLRESNNIEDEWDDVSLAQAIYAWDYIVKEDKLSIGAILKTHKILMLHHNLMSDEKGYFRKGNVMIGGKLGKPPYALSTLMDAWVVSANATLQAKESSAEYLSGLIRKDHIAYEAIHPFIDGNGRTGRIFLNWQRVKCNLPILVVKEKEKNEYYKWFK